MARRTPGVAERLTDRDLPLREEAPLAEIPKDIAAWRRRQRKRLIAERMAMSAAAHEAASASIVRALVECLGRYRKDRSSNRGAGLAHSNVRQDLSSTLLTSHS